MPDREFQHPERAVLSEEQVDACEAVMKDHVEQPTATLMAAMTSANHPEGITALLRRRFEVIDTSATTPLDGMMKRMEWLELSREALLKSATLCGFPLVINAMHACMEAVPEELRGHFDQDVERRVAKNMQDLDHWRLRGLDYFRTIYGDHGEAILENLRRSSPHMHEVIVQDMYGKIISDTSRLSIAQSQLVAVATLYPLNVPRQMRGHVRGAIKVGVSKESIRSVLRMARIVCRHS